MAGCWVRGQGQAVGRGGPGFERRDRLSSSQADPGEGGSHLGGGVGQRGPGGRVAEAYVEERVRSFARRWIVERTFSWLGQNRRMSNEYERLTATAEAFIYAAMTRLMVRRLARA